MTVLSVLLFAAVLAVPGTFLALVTPSRFEEALPAGILALDLVLFLFGVVGLLKAGALAVCVFALLLALGSVILPARRPAIRKGAMQRIFTPWFFVYWLLVLALIAFNYGKLMTSWDEFSHWGDTVKAMTITGALSSSPANQAMFPEYPPAMALIQYLAQAIICRLTGVAFTEWALYVAWQLFLFSLFFPFLSDFSFRSVKPWLLMVCLFLLPTCFQEQVYSKIYIDTFLGALFGVGVALLLSPCRSAVWHVSFFLILAVLPLTKSSGILFSVALAMLFCYDLFRRNGTRRKLCVGCCISSVGLPLLIWKISIALNKATETYGFSALLPGSSASTDRSAWASGVLKHYISAFFTRTLTNSDALLPWCSAAVVCALLFFLLAILLHRQKEGSFSGKGCVVLLGVLGLTLFAFVAGTCAVMMYSFIHEEAEVLLGFERYLNTVFYALALATLLFAFQLLDDNRLNGKPFLVVLLITALCLVPWMQVARFALRREVVYSHSYRAETESAAAGLEAAGITDGSVFIEYENYENMDYMMLRTRLRPASVTYSTFENKTAADLAQYDAILLFEMNDSFIENYGSLFENEADIQLNGVYAVSPESGLLQRIIPSGS